MIFCHLLVVMRLFENLRFPKMFWVWVFLLGFLNWFSSLVEGITHFFKTLFDVTPSIGYAEQWFGKKSYSRLYKADDSVRNFKIAVSEGVLQDLNIRLIRARLEDPVENSLFNYGFNPSFLKEVIKYWSTRYDWRRQEAQLNAFPHFKTRLEGIDVHFMHVKPKLPEGSELRVIPLMLIHGWPGSVVEFLKVIPILIEPREVDFVFEVICPSIPGFGFSESPHCKGFNARACARIFVSLMERLGHPHFYCQGGDWGSCIASLMARYYSASIIGVHMNSCFFAPRSWDLMKLIAASFIPSMVSPQEYKIFYPLGSKLKTFLRESGYFHMNATKPDTIGCCMSDSPAGLAAVLLEQFSVGTSTENVNCPDGGLTQKFKIDDLLTNVMVYWVNNNFASAARFYKENTEDSLGRVHERIPITVPCAVTVFPNEALMYPHKMLSQQIKNLVSYTIMPKEGHFAALEEPIFLADDMWRFVSYLSLLEGSKKLEKLLKFS